MVQPASLLLFENSRRDVKQTRWLATTVEAMFGSCCYRRYPQVAHTIFWPNSNVLMS